MQITMVWIKNAQKGHIAEARKDQADDGNRTNIFGGTRAVILEASENVELYAPFSEIASRKAESTFPTRSPGQN